MSNSFCQIALFTMLLSVYACSKPLQELADSLNAKNNKIGGYYCYVIDSTYDKQEHNSKVLNYYISEIIDSIVYINFTDNPGSLKTYKVSSGSDSILLVEKLDSSGYYTSHKQYLQETYLADSAGKATIRQHWLAQKMLSETGTINYGLLVEQMAKLRPSEGYPQVERKVLNTQQIKDSIGINTYLGNSFYRLIAKFTSLVQGTGDKYYSDPDSLRRIGAISDSVYVNTSDKIDVRIVTNGTEHKFYIDLLNNVVYKYEQESQDFIKTLTITKYRF